MRVTLGSAGLEFTWQHFDKEERKFPETTSCVYCHGESRIGFVAHEGLRGQDLEGPFVCNLHSNGGKGDFWLHDACAVAIYFCRECLKPTALYNQA